MTATRSVTVTKTYTAQYRDWSGRWCGDGTVHSTAGQARDHCFRVLVQCGYSGVDVRVLEHAAKSTVREIHL